VLLAANLADDADTVAAVTGQIAGGLHPAALGRAARLAARSPSFAARRSASALRRASSSPTSG
jgi:hypothetical protein